MTDALVAARDPLYFADRKAPHRPAALLLFEADVANHVENVAGLPRPRWRPCSHTAASTETTLGIEGAGGDGSGRRG